jgi:PHS family inorganic phosphate transporter-like MFS transporter
MFLIDKIGRFIIQLGGFLMMSILMAILGFKYGYLRGEIRLCGPYSQKGFLRWSPHNVYSYLWAYLLICQLWTQQHNLHSSSRIVSSKVLINMSWYLDSIGKNRSYNWCIYCTVLHSGWRLGWN